MNNQRKIDQAIRNEYPKDNKTVVVYRREQVAEAFGGLFVPSLRIDVVRFYHAGVFNYFLWIDGTSFDIDGGDEDGFSRVRTSRRFMVPELEIDHVAQRFADREFDSLFNALVHDQVELLLNIEIGRRLYFADGRFFNILSEKLSSDYSSSYFVGYFDGSKRIERLQLQDGDEFDFPSSPLSSQGWRQEEYESDDGRPVAYWLIDRDEKLLSAVVKIDK